MALSIVKLKVPVLRSNYALFRYVSWERVISLALSFCFQSIKPGTQNWTPYLLTYRFVVVDICMSYDKTYYMDRVERDQHLFLLYLMNLYWHFTK